LASGRLYESATVKLNGSGNGTAKVGPLTAREVWYPQNAHVSANQNPTNQAQCYIYIGDQPVQYNFRDATISGSSGDSTDRINADVIKKGQYIWAVWSNGDPNVTAILTVTGTKDI
jgi:hypothetical protein